ncbi:MAG TPA: lysophospholipid acyltransferase family protein [Bacteroidia bacterium]|nr:lysophospholipid acyltransferase family protein [Bacteroidia bacterium]
MRFLYKFFFEQSGWKINGDVPRDIKKYIIIVAPHTSNWDFPLGLAVRSIMKFPSNFLGKKELFRPPFGWLFRKLGGFPVDRKGSHNLVDQVADIFNREEQFIIAIAPEGTRKNVSKWKTGFYHIALKAKIPIVMAAMDYPSKTVFFSLPFFPTGNMKEDVLSMENFFRDKRGKNRGVTPILG